MKILSQPALLRASRWRSRVCSVVETRAYPISIGNSLRLEDRELTRPFLLAPLEMNPRTALYMTRVNRKTWLISSSLGTRPSSSWRATAILALRRRFFCSGWGCHHFHCIINSLPMSRYETLIMRRVYNTSCRSLNRSGDPGKTPCLNKRSFCATLYQRWGYTLVITASRSVAIRNLSIRWAAHAHIFSRGRARRRLEALGRRRLSGEATSRRLPSKIANERAGSARKRSSAEGVGCATNRYPAAADYRTFNEWRLRCTRYGYGKSQATSLPFSCR